MTYCSSDKFKQAFAFSNLDFAVIQIDTDQHDPVHFNIPTMEDGVETLPERKYEFAKAILVSSIGETFYESVRERIVFAICVESVECWLLPLFFASTLAKRSKTKNCYDTLLTHPKLRSLEKNPRQYQEISKPLAKRKELANYTRHQASFARFVADAEECLRRIASGVTNDAFGD